jgi:hypothetical protein
MAEENVFIKKLIEARDHEVEQRRYVADDLAEGYKCDHTGKMREAFIRIQNTNLPQKVWPSRQSSQPISRRNSAHAPDALKLSGQQFRQ